MFKKYEAINNAIGTDNEVFLEYLQNDLNGVIPEKYRTTEGRIIIVNGTTATEEADNVGLLAFGRLIQITNENAKQQVFFKNYDTVNVLKKFVKFTVTIIYSTSSLRRLAEKTVNATGIKERNETNENGVDIYNVTYEGTSGLNIESSKSNGDYCFYDEGGEAQCETRKVVGNADMNVNFDTKIHNMIRDGQNSFFVNNTDSFDLNVVLNDAYSLEDNSNITFKCLNGTDLNDFYMDCLLTNVNAKKYKINCKPTEPIYTTIKTVELIYNITGRRNIRILEEIKEQHRYTTFPNDTNANESLVFIPNNTNSTTPTDDDTIYKFKKNRTSKNGLNSGAITAIVLASVAALAGVAAAIYCLNRPKPNMVSNMTNAHGVYSSQNQMNV
jgi:hypothetical protein